VVELEKRGMTEKAKTFKVIDRKIQLFNENGKKIIYLEKLNDNRN